MTSATLTGLAAWLTVTLGETGTLKRGGPEDVARLALALEPRDLPDDLDADAAFVHRSRHVDGHWPGLGILGAHDGFDLHLTTGPNRRLAAALGWQDVREVAWEGRVFGIVARPPQAAWEELRAALHAELGGEDSSTAPQSETIRRVAVMNAMTPALVGHVAGLGADVYLTGQLRPSAVPAARAAGIGVVALGHRRTELWGLRTLARELEAAFPGLDTRVYGSP